MKYTKLGNSELTVSKLCLGCMGFGDASIGQHRWIVDEAATRDIVRRALELGVNFFDTALAYAGGTSEQYLGRALRDFARREDVVVATKFLPKPPESPLSAREHITRSLDTSLRNLGMDHVDLYIYHMWDYHSPIEEILSTLNEAVQAGKVRNIGISNCFAWQLCKANAIAAREGWAQFVSIQGHYNLIAREEEREMVPFCRAENIALTPYSALAGGRLSRLPEESSNRRELDGYAKFKYDASADIDAPIIRRVAELAERRQVSMTEIALAWLMSRVTAPVVGATKPAQIEGAARAAELVLTDEEMQYLEELYLPHPLVGVMAQNTAAGRVTTT